MNKKFLESITAVAPYVIVGITFLVTILALVSLILSDVITGQVAGAHISTNFWFGLFVSFSTTGMLIGCGSLLVKFWRESSYLSFGILVFIFIGLQSADVYFDAISVDIMRFGKIIFSSEMPDAAEAMAHNIYRFLVGGISLVGEPLAIGSLVMFQALKKFISDTMQDMNFYDNQGSSFQNRPQNRPQNHPQNRPAHKPQPTAAPQNAPGGKLVSPVFNGKYTDRYKEPTYHPKMRERSRDE